MRFWVFNQGISRASSSGFRGDSPDSVSDAFMLGQPADNKNPDAREDIRVLFFHGLNNRSSFLSNGVYHSRDHPRRRKPNERQPRKQCDIFIICHGIYSFEVFTLVLIGSN